MIQIDKVSKSFGKIQALNEISLTINNSELFGFIGPDGAGKTTLFRLIASLLLPDSGSISIGSFDTLKDYKKIRQILGYMPGRFSLYYDLTVEENLNFYATIFGTSLSENYDLIKDIYQQIEPFKNRPAGKLSGGMKQKLALSCALIHKPKILILDEPTTGVDAVSRVEFWDMLKQLKKAGITIIVSTPYMDEAMRCERIALIQNGNILSIDTPEHIVNQFDSNIYSIEGRPLYPILKALRQYQNTKSAFPFGQNLHITLQQDTAKEVEQLEQYLRSKDFNDFMIAKTKPGIEDCFMDLMIKKEAIHD